MDGAELSGNDGELDGAELGAGAMKKSTAATAAQAASSPASSALLLSLPDDEAAPVTPALIEKLGHVQTLIFSNKNPG